MAKSAKQVKQAKPQAATPAPVVPAVVTTVASTATKLTKRSNVQLGQTLVVTGKPAKHRAAHVQAAWAAVQAACPATAQAMATAAADPKHPLSALMSPACVSPQAFISYMLRRGYLAVQGS